MSDSNNLLLLLGRMDTDPQVEAALVQFAIRNRPEVEINEDDPDGPVVETQSWVKNSRAGIEFGFQDQAAWLGLDETEFGKRRMVLTQIYFYGRQKGVRPFVDALPFGLTVDDSRTAVRAKMAAAESTRHSHIRDTWDLSNCRVTASYSDDKVSVAFVLCSLRELPLPPLSYDLARVPAPDQLISLLGLSLSDPAVHDALDPLGLQDRVERIAEEGEADFRVPYGLSVDFATLPVDRRSGTGDSLVSGITLYQERELDARAWPGALPNGLGFDDSLEMAARKVGRPPDHMIDDDFSGVAVWHSPSHSLRLVFNEMENRLLRVGLVAPGMIKAQ